MKEVTGAVVLAGVVAFGYAYDQDPHMLTQAGAVLLTLAALAAAILLRKIRRSLAAKKTEQEA